MDKHQDVIAACRFCFMCRHLDPVGNVTFQEADTPRGRALILDKVRMDSENLKNSDFIATLYRSALSGANRFHCVSHYDEVGLVLAARRDVVEACLAPESVKALAEKLSRATFTVKGKGDVLYFGDSPNLYPGCKTISGGDPGKALETLGFVGESQKVFDGFKKAVAASRCKTLIVAEPSAFDFLKDTLDGIKVVHCSEHLLSTKVKAARARKAVYLESDFLKNYDGNPTAPRQLLARCGYKLVPFGTNSEESYSAGEGAVVFDELNPELCEKLCQRVYAIADSLKKDLFITPSRYVKATLAKYNPQIRVMTLEEAVAQRKV
jgi:Fe-S oxidoreductase